MSVNVKQLFGRLGYVSGPWPVADYYDLKSPGVEGTWKKIFWRFVWRTNNA